MKSLIKTEDVGFLYQHSVLNSGIFSLKNISIDVDEGDFISVIGKNGSGKSTLVKLISRILIGYKGNIFYDSREIHSIDRKEYSKSVSYIPQTTAALNDELITAEFLKLGRYSHKGFTDFRYSEADRKVVNESITKTGIESLTEKHLYELSGGEKQKVMITLGLVQLDITKSLEKKVLIIDEPLTYLDINYQFEIFSILKSLNENGLTVIIVIHDLNLALRFTNKTILMNAGEVVKYSDSGNVITEEMLREHFQINSQIINFENNFLINYLPNQ